MIPPLGVVIKPGVIPSLGYGHGKIVFSDVSAMKTRIKTMDIVSQASGIELGYQALKGTFTNPP